MFFLKAQEVADLMCNFDRFANNFNTKCPYFNSVFYCIGTSGVDCFNYDWSSSVNWLFPAPRLVIKTINHLRLCKGVGILVTPLWKSSDFYPYILSEHIKVGVMGHWIFPGQNVFVSGADKSSFFNPNFNSAVVVWKLDFRQK